MKDVSPVRIYIKLVRDRPRDFFLVTLGASHDASCGTGSTLSDALRDLADHLDFRARQRFDDDLRKLLFKEGP